ncbi:MAG: response regulator, partial [Deltaproteobacteria bacterium]|nr:response regulator [Deltaproteobacteria bacterium]
MARIGTRKSGYRVVVVDDDDVLLESTVALLIQQGHEVASATDASVAVDRVRATRPHVVLLDYHLGGATGADVVRAIRAFDPLVQILLVTGYASEQPARRMLTELDIQGYHDKSDGPERLLVLLDATLKHAATVLRLDRHRRVLRRLLDLGVAVSRLASVEVIFTEALEGVAALLG